MLVDLFAFLLPAPKCFTGGDLATGDGSSGVLSLFVIDDDCCDVGDVGNSGCCCCDCCCCCGDDDGMRFDFVGDVIGSDKIGAAVVVVVVVAGVATAIVDAVFVVVVAVESLLFVIPFDVDVVVVDVDVAVVVAEDDDSTFLFGQNLEA